MLHFYAYESNLLRKLEFHLKISSFVLTGSVWAGITVTLPNTKADPSCDSQESLAPGQKRDWSSSSVTVRNPWLQGKREIGATEKHWLESNKSSAALSPRWFFIFRLFLHDLHLFSTTAPVTHSLIWMSLQPSDTVCTVPSITGLFVARVLFK